MNQMSLFDAPAEPAWRPDPERVRARLARILAEVRDPEAGWDAAQASLWRTIVPEMTRWLPEAEAAEWRTTIAAELARMEGG
jgi:hypothetical protein